MSMLDIDVSDAEEPKAVPGNEEYRLTIISMRVAVDKGGFDFVLPTFDIPDEPLAKPFTKYLRLPTPKLREEKGEKAFKTAAWNYKLFLQCFGMDPGRKFEADEMVGNTGWAILGVEETDEYGDQNFIKKFLAPKS